jgi:RNA recognition motif-containing protein
MKIFVGNLAAETVEQDLMSAFQVFGNVEHVNIAKTNADGHSRGFGFVDVMADGEARAAIVGLNGTNLHGQVLRVSEAHRKCTTR